MPAVATCEPTTEAIIVGVRRLLTDPQLGNTLRESRATLEAKYHIEEISKTYVQLYMDIAKRRTERLHVPTMYFISPFAAIHSRRAYLSENPGEPLQSYDLTVDEATVLAQCSNATSIEEIELTTGLSHATICSTLDTLTNRKIIIGGRNGRGTEY